MPGSAFNGKIAGRQLLEGLPPVHTVLDVGPGHGTWRFWCLMCDLFPAAEWTALEIWAPYVERYRLRRWYDKTIVGDAFLLAHAPVGSVEPYDLAIFGDVVEHLPRPKAEKMVLGIPWRHALISIPLGPYPQEASEGNPYEAHLSTWSPRDVCEAFPVTKWVLDDPIGVFLLERRLLAPLGV